MRGRHGTWIVGLLVAALGAAVVGVHASSAAPTRGNTAASTLDKTFSCRVRRQHFINLTATATAPPVNNQPQPGGVFVTTVNKTRKVNNALEILTQLGFSASKNSLRIDTSTCTHVKQQIPLKQKGLSGPITVTATQFGHDNEQCGTAGRVLVRLRVSSTNHTPTHALLAIRNQNASHKPIAFYNWAPNKVNVFIGGTCRSLG
jgi:hypothetical protein